LLAQSSIAVKLFFHFGLSARGLITAAETMEQADVVKLLTKNLQQEEKRRRC